MVAPTKQYLPTKDYHLPDIDLLSLIFGEHRFPPLNVASW